VHQVVHKNKVEDIKAFFETDTNTILKYVCKSEDHFLLYLKENQKLVAHELVFDEKQYRLQSEKRLHSQTTNESSYLSVHSTNFIEFVLICQSG